MKALTLGLLLLVTLVAARPVFAGCVCVTYPCPCATTAGRFCLRVEPICPIRIDALNYLKVEEN